MAVSDVAIGWSSVANNGFLDVLPNGSTTGSEWAIFSFQGEAQFEVYKTDGTNSKLVVPAGMAGPATLTQLNLCATTGIYYRLKNISGASAYLGYDARVTK